MSWEEEASLRRLSPVIIDTQLLVRAVVSRYVQHLGTRLFFVAPLDVVSLHSAIVWVLDRLIHLVISCKSKRHHEPVIGCELKICLEKVVTRADLNRGIAKVHQSNELYAGVEDDRYRHNHREAEPLARPLVFPPVR